MTIGKVMVSPTSSIALMKSMYPMLHEEPLMALKSRGRLAVKIGEKRLNLATEGGMAGCGVRVGGMLGMCVRVSGERVERSGMIGRGWLGVGTRVGPMSYPPGPKQSTSTAHAATRPMVRKAKKI